ncbi:hypothetical protein PROFUN_02039 [Planoprotostelium fungivorum]|uniref:Uncharacterized protein n=1 Tax=Planoprotostelium fungivorum TaxID=1890364 RepID=A0A2P6NB69_9EUKA|nr:hypothetical protein PROFUN_02039 [Planoprotostelium fungivorum]
MSSKKSCVSSVLMWRSAGSFNSSEFPLSEAAVTGSSHSDTTGARWDETLCSRSLQNLRILLNKRLKKKDMSAIDEILDTIPISEQELFGGHIHAFYDEIDPYHLGKWGAVAYLNPSVSVDIQSFLGALYKSGLYNDLAVTYWAQIVRPYYDRVRENEEGKQMVRDEIERVVLAYIDTLEQCPLPIRRACADGYRNEGHGPDDLIKACCLIFGLVLCTVLVEPASVEPRPRSLQDFMNDCGAAIAQMTQQKVSPPAEPLNSLFRELTPKVNAEFLRSIDDNEIELCSKIVAASAKPNHKKIQKIEDSLRQFFSTLQCEVSSANSGESQMNLGQQLTLMQKLEGWRVDKVNDGLTFYQSKLDGISARVDCESDKSITELIPIIISSWKRQVQNPTIEQLSENHSKMTFITPASFLSPPKFHSLNVWTHQSSHEGFIFVENCGKHEKPAGHSYMEMDVSGVYLSSNGKKTRISFIVHMRGGSSLNWVRRSSCKETAKLLARIMSNSK